MTEKQFVAIGENIWQNGEVWCVAGGKHCADVIATALNEQHETIQEQKDTINEMRDKGLNVLNFYEDKLKNAKSEEVQEVREELWIVKFLLYEMGIIE